ncbi:type 1 glutamine amidotransferase [Halobaculum sp. WSA2]|uniref:Type 1 glutamine amidotransferase n=1 Tax=Halobaculum saliterrae TaxID=2073113 RepID=A0A6B0SNV3_9EURY|nr:type 1 glutamine amidotransferase [Halobaculum saliterrae]MXR40405.1 type 1 glutamine amidotransferase [Halobaculum saliterrae]
MILVLDNAVDGGYMAGEIVHFLPEARAYNYPNEDGDPNLDDVDGVVIGGSGAGVYDEPDQPWIADQKRLARRLVEEGVPTLGICFGHQILNAALGGAVEDSGTTRLHLRDAEFDDEPLFNGVEPTVPVLHSDVVTELGDGMEVIGRADYYEYFATRHRDSPVWSVQYHPEFTPRIVDEYDGWEESARSFEESTATRTLANFADLVESYAND